MFKIEKGYTGTTYVPSPSKFRLELRETMNKMESGDSFVIPYEKAIMFYRERALRKDVNSFYSNKVGNELRIFKR